MLNLTLKSSVFWDVTSCGPLKVNWRFGRTCRLHDQGRRTGQARNQHETGSKPCLAYSSTLMMEATCSSETLVDLQRTTRRSIPEGKTLHNLNCENPKFCNLTLPLHEIIPEWPHGTKQLFVLLPCTTFVIPAKLCYIGWKWKYEENVVQCDVKCKCQNTNEETLKQGRQDAWSLG
jgi:hypothetical protein